MTNPNATENVIIHHKVKDYNAWRSAYDGHEKRPRFCWYHQR